jgi:hypothetical protein
MRTAHGGLGRPAPGVRIHEIGQHRTRVGIGVVRFDDRASASAQDLAETADIRTDDGRTRRLRLQGDQSEAL